MLSLLKIRIKIISELLYLHINKVVILKLLKLSC